MKFLQTKIRNLNIQGKLIIAYVIIISIPLSFLTTYIYGLYQKDNEKNYISIIETHLSQLSYDIDKVLTEAQTLSDYLANNEQVTDYLRNYQNNKEYYDYQAVRYLGAYLSSIAQINPKIYSIHIFTTNPDIPRYRRIILPVRYIAGEDIYGTIGALRYGQKLWSALHNDRDFTDLNSPNDNFTPLPVFSLYQNIYAENLTDILGYLELNITTEEISKIVMNHAFGTDDVSLVVENNGDIIFKTPNAPGLVLTADMFKVSAPGTLSAVYAGRDKYVYRFAGVPSLHVRLILLYPYKSIVSAANTRIFSLAVVLLSGFATLLLVFYLISALIFKRLKALTNQMKTVQNGNLGVIVKIGPSDEVGILENAFASMLSKINHLINAEYKALIAEKEAKLSYLQAQMNPHFLFNSLEVLRMIAEVDDNGRVADGLFSLGKVLKAHINAKTMSKIAEEIDIVQCYVYVQNLRLGDRARLEVTVQENLESEEIPALTLQPLVENSMIHGFKFKTPDYRIQITIRTSAGGDDIRIDVCDNGAGFDSETLAAIQDYIATGNHNNIPSGGNGIALVNLHERIRLYYGSPYGLSVTSGGGRTRVSITLGKRPIYNTADTSPHTRSFE